MADAGDAAPAAAEVAALSTAQEQAHMRTVRTCCGQGAKGFMQMQRLLRQSRGSAWVSMIPLSDAIKMDNLAILRYLVEEVKVETLNLQVEGYSPVQLAVIWGKPEILVYLLSRGGDPLLGSEYSAADMARMRQQRLREAHANSGDGAEFEGFSITRREIEPLLEEGQVILEVMEGVEAQGSFQAWAERNGRHPLVRRFSEGVVCSEPRYQLLVARELVATQRATLLSLPERAALEAEAAALEAARAKEEQPLADVLVEAGFTSSAAKELRDAFRIPTLKKLRDSRPSPEDIEAKLEPYVRQKRMQEGEKRKFARFVRELEDAPAVPLAKPALPTAAGAKAAAAPGAAAKKAAKGPAPQAKAALLAMAAGGKAKAAPSKAFVPAARAKKASDGLALLFDADLPLNAFATVVRFLHGV